MSEKLIPTWKERLAHLDKPTDFAEAQAAKMEAAELRRYIRELESASQPGGGEALAWIPEEAIAMLKPPLLLLTGVTLYRYDAVGTRALYLRAAPSAGNGGAEGDG